MHVDMHQYTPRRASESRAHKGYAPYTPYLYKIYKFIYIYR